MEGRDFESYMVTKMRPGVLLMLDSVTLIGGPYDISQTPICDFCTIGWSWRTENVPLTGVCIESKGSKEEEEGR